MMISPSKISISEDGGSVDIVVILLEVDASEEAAGTPSGAERRVVLGDGSSVWVRARGNPYSHFPN
jgi:hypothetical protein